ncbi:MAG: YqgE/AlgH family protein [Pseudomonadota bacterium]
MLRDVEDQDFLAGQMLIAMPNMGDPRFERTVILICAHDVDHAMGVIINKRVDDADFEALIRQLDIAPRESANDMHVYFGGPVQTERGLVLHTLDYQTDRTVSLPGGVGLTATRDILNDIAGAAPKRSAPRRFLLAVGHAGWSGGQLEQEIAMNAWAHCEADLDLIFDGDEHDTWRKALSKLGVTSAMLSQEWAAPRDLETPLN